jgi:hypothetical protein
MKNHAEVRVSPAQPGNVRKLNTLLASQGSDAENTPGSSSVVVASSIPESNLSEWRARTARQNAVHQCSFWTEELRLSKVNGAWATALRVTGFQTNTSMGNELYEEVDKIFPRQSDGTVNWTQYLPPQ